MFKLKKKTGILYPSEVFDEFGCLMSWELVTIVAESNSWKTTFWLDLIRRNSKNGVKWFYFNLEFPIETMWLSRWLWLNWKSREDLTSLGNLTEEEEKDLEKYVNDNLKEFQYHNSPNGIEMSRLEQIMEVAAIDGYKLFVIDSFSMIKWNSENNSRWNQNKCMQELQELAQRLDVTIVVLHHTNRQWTWEWTQKIMDLSNVMIVITKEEDCDFKEYRTYSLIKDKFQVNKSLDVYYYWWKYEKL